ncbi:MAG: N-acyl-D-amino-acid deacylase [Bacillati bacterium ANGP1]|uniref:N-acyl-D-amino-acid deacylase n=1 Tax=Candidatus Segetimicrobium genomatis TaxID=2569760 RepID=A0A537K5T7_9BACT|nr:MAG: N-acyl-D-amino-acid deacylase [Terrabacteria group bacterium ANGP1]
MDLIIRQGRVDDEGPLADIGVRDGRIDQVAPAVREEARRELHAGGKVVIPGLIEPHIHPDKAFLEQKMPNRSGTLEEAIRNTAALKARYTAEDVRERAERVLEWAVRRGTTTLRAHPDVDPIEKLMGVEALLALRQAYADVLDLQIVAFPQEGIIKAPGTEELMREAIRLGADAVGGCPYNEAGITETRRHIDICFRLAAQHGLPIDMHVDFADDVDDPRYTTAEYIARKTIAEGYQGRVSLGHVTTLGAVAPEARASLFELLAQAGISIVMLPATDLHLSGRKDRRTVRRGLAPAKELLAAGVNVAISSNNIRNAFTPFGLADMLQIGLLLCHTAHMGSPGEQMAVLRMATVNAARAIGIGDVYGLAAGRQADLLVLDTERVADVLVDQPDRLYVVKRGQVTVTTHRTVEVHRGPGTRSGERPAAGPSRQADRIREGGVPR